MHEIYSSPLQRRHFAGYLSCAQLINVLYWAGLIIVPFFIAYTTRDFWFKFDTYREQPEVLFEHKVIFQAESADKPPLFFSTIPQFNEVVGFDRVQPAIVKASVVDPNHDGLEDEINVKISVSLPEDYPVQTIHALLFMTYRLHGRVTLNLEGMLYFHHTSPIPGRQLTASGDLKLRQRNPFIQKGWRDHYSLGKRPVIDAKELFDQDDVSIASILRRYSTRNDTLVVENPFDVWEAAGACTSFTLDAKIFIPEESIEYIPDVGQTLKNAWIQYLSFFWIIYFLLSIAREFLFRYQVVETAVINDGAPLKKFKEF